MLKNAQIPEHLLIIGGGYIGCEFAAIYRTLGVQVTLIEEEQSLLPSWDPIAGDQIRESLLKKGVTVYLNAKVNRPLRKPGRHVQFSTVATACLHPRISR